MTNPILSRKGTADANIAAYVRARTLSHLPVLVAAGNAMKMHSRLGWVHLNREV